MTFRAKPAGRRRPTWESDDRRNMYMNIGFGLVVLAAVLILAAAAGLNWYREHLEPVGSVNGASITKDDFRARAEVELFRLRKAESRIEDEFNAGRIDEATRQAQQQFIQQRNEQLEGIVLEQMIDTRVQAVLAGQEGITVTDAEIEEAITKESTTPEQRHVWVIEAEPEVDEDAEAPTEAQKAAARAKAEAALADLEAGKTWDEVAKVQSTALSSAEAGDLGFQYLEGSLDAALAEAVFSLEDEAHTGVIEGEDGIYRIGRVTEIVAPVEDTLYRTAIEAEGISLPLYKAAVEADLIRRKLEDKIKTQALAAGPQRRVSQIFIPAPEPAPDGGPLPDDAIRVRHVLYSPGDDPSAAEGLPADDPAWKAAEDEARAAYDKVKADPDAFDAIARAETDDSASAETGGKQPYYSAISQLDPAFATAILDPAIQPGQLLEPVRSGFGWHVIQAMYRAPDLDRAKAIKAAFTAGTDFAELARSDSYGPEVADDGEVGWIARYQLDQAQEETIFGAAIDQLSDPVEAPDGIHLYLVHEEEERELDEEQRAIVEDSAFPNWYNAKKDTFEIHRLGEEEAAV